MVQVAICDDDCLYVDKIVKSLNTFFNRYHVQGKLYTYERVGDIDINVLAECDIVLLDIDFKDSSDTGIDIAKKLRNKSNDVIIIFITNYIEYAPEGYEVRAFRYVLKDRIDTDLNKYIYEALEQIKEIRDIMKIKTNGEIIDLEIGNIYFFEVSQHYITAYIQRKGESLLTKILFYGSLSEIEEQLHQHGFLRVHNSYLVNMRYIVKFGCREVMLSNGTCLKVSEKKYKENKEKYLAWKGWNA